MQFAGWRNFLFWMFSIKTEATGCGMGFQMRTIWVPSCSGGCAFTLPPESFFPATCGRVFLFIVKLTSCFVSFYLFGMLSVQGSNWQQQKCWSLLNHLMGRKKTPVQTRNLEIVSYQKKCANFKCQLVMGFKQSGSKSWLLKIKLR